MQALTAYHVDIFGIDLEFDSVAFTLPFGDGWDIYWYGICIALAFLAAVTYGFVRAKKFGIDPDRLTDVVLVTAPLAILCARIYYIIFYPGDLKISSIGDFLGISGSSGVSGLAIYGAVIGAAVVGLTMCLIRKVKILDAFDLASICFLIGQSIGRWGNFFNQEAFGSPTNSNFWGMVSEGTENVRVHPCFLYESIWCALGFVLLHFLSKHRKFKGQIALSYGIWYGFGRMIIEGLRTDSLYLGPLRVSQWLSGALVIVCTVLLIYNLVKIKNAKVAETYETMFDDIDDTTVKTVYYEGDGDAAESDGETPVTEADGEAAPTDAPTEAPTEADTADGEAPAENNNDNTKKDDN